MKKMICIVEDDPDIRDLISYIMLDDHYDVLMCGSVKEFFELLNKAIPDVVVFDIMLPDGSGMDLCREMKVKETTASVPVLLMSAHYRPEEAMQAGCAEAFIAKPFDIDYFKDKVTTYLTFK
jgi:DNA-binding response OmpR family regulator